MNLHIKVEVTHRSYLNLAPPSPPSATTGLLSMLSRLLPCIVPRKSSSWYYNFLVLNQIWIYLLFEV